MKDFFIELFQNPAQAIGYIVSLIVIVLLLFIIIKNLGGLLDNKRDR